MGKLYPRIRKTKEIMKEVQRIENYINGALDIDIQEPTRKRDIVEGRFLYAAIAKKCTNLSLEKIGKHIGKDHATIIHSLKVYNAVLSKKYKSLFDTYYFNYLVRKEREVSEDQESDELKQLKEIRSLKAKVEILNVKLSDAEVENITLNLKLTNHKPFLSDYYDLSEEDQELVKIRMDAIIKMLPSKQKRKEEFEIINCSS